LLRIIRMTLLFRTCAVLCCWSLFLLVVWSFCDWTSGLLLPEGNLTKYLLCSNMCLIFGDTLFTHGSLHKDSIWFVPPYGGKKGYEGPRHLKDWANELNAFAQHEAREFSLHADEYLSKIETGDASVWSKVGGYDHAQPGSRLIQTGLGTMPDNSVNPTVIYSSYVNLGKTLEPDDEVLRALNENGIKRVVVGHQPVGDVPAVFRFNRPGVGDLQVLCCDTSYAAVVKWVVELGEDEPRLQSVINDSPQESTAPHFKPSPKDSSRGVAVSELIICVNNGRSKCFMHGILSNGFPYEYEVPEPDDIEAPVGSQLEDHWMVRASVSPTTTVTEHSTTNEPAAYLISKQEGFVVQNRLISKATMEQMALPKPVYTKEIKLVVENEPGESTPEASAAGGGKGSSRSPETTSEQQTVASPKSEAVSGGVTVEVVEEEEKQIEPQKKKSKPIRKFFGHVAKSMGLMSKKNK